MGEDRMKVKIKSMADLGVAVLEKMEVEEGQSKKMEDSLFVEAKHIMASTSVAKSTVRIYKDKAYKNKLVLARLLARNNLGDPLINLLNPAHPTIPHQQQQLVNSLIQSVAPFRSGFQSQSHIPPPPPNPSQLVALDISKRLDNLERKIAENRVVPPGQASSTLVSASLNTNIVQEPYPSGFKMPQFKTYDITKDPDDHFITFCFVILKLNSISLYVEMATAIATKFSSRRLIKKTIAKLMQVIPREGESLKNYINRFNDAMLEIDSFDQAIGITAIIQGLSHERYHTKYCDFHQDHGHVIEECNSLKFKLEGLARKGMLNDFILNKDHLKFVKEQGQESQGPRGASNKTGVGYQQAPPPLPTLAQIIHMINRGLEAEGMSSKQQKLYVREVKHQNQARKRKFDDEGWKNQPITFISANLGSVVTPHNDWLDKVEPEGKKGAHKLLESKQGCVCMDLSRYAWNFDLGCGAEVKHQPSKETLVQKRCLFRGERLQTIKEKSNGKWRMCIDYTNLNDACPKYCHPMPNIDKLVEAASRNERSNILEDGNNCVMSSDKPESRECQTAFDELKTYLSSPPLLTKVEEGEILYLYLGISNTIVSSVLVKQLGKWQRPVYYADNILQGVEQRYSIAKKVDFAKARMLGKTHQIGSRARGVPDNIPTEERPSSETKAWFLYVDGSSNNKGLGAGVVLTGLGNFRNEHALKFNFEATNNMAEYEALLLGLCLVAEVKVKHLQIYSDSQLVVNQVNSMCEGTDPTLAKYVAVVSELRCHFEKFQLMKVLGAENEHAYSLSKLASDSSKGVRFVYVEILNEPSFQTSKEMKLWRKASWYTLVDDVFYKRSYSLPLLRCLTPYEAQYALREMHEGVCENHVGAWTLARKVLRKGETPYHLAFDIEAVIPVEIGISSLKVSHFDPARNEQLLKENLDFLDKVREQSRLRTLTYKKKVASFYNKRVRPISFRINGLVLRRAGLTGFETHFGKLAPNWEGPYTVTEIPHPGACIL
ncbi:hypothetical protein SLEP1_g42492 [Rubroshorea leprosula]|uniref:RNase H type-1 domain-containing protein n=1 Tax=Rubroshorea leprosula TaxID=152421 RepID=A0AAV5LA11_9ROSI|nr:hypothetical protein SLEP1_g42492 [Rubroshorea leprosula]